MRHYRVYVLFFISSSLYASYWKADNFADKAVVRVPVADATTRPLQPLDAQKTAQELYNLLPLAPDKHLLSCYRTHQFLFNETVTIKRTQGLEVECALDNFFYIDDDGKVRNSFWTLKSNILPLSGLIKNQKINAVPAPYCTKKGEICSHTGLLSLSWPWYNPSTQQTYSAGTRFIRKPEKDTPTRYAIALLDSTNLAVKIGYVPKDYSIIEFAKTKDQSKRMFVRMLKKWVANPSGIIGYVWGGCSFIKSYRDNRFSLVSDIRFGKQVEFWQRPEDCERPFTGCECSALILRVAQLCGMPYFYRNTTTIEKCLRPLGRNERVEEGDIIWYQGHVQIVSDLRHNKLIEAVGYQAGYGITHEIELEKVFAGIKTYRDLMQVHFTKKPLKRLDKNKKPLRTIRELKILKLSSLWENV
ncbi:hypothetical protein H0X48_02785 [Candidatus Dependentiae bacterium]|nr:hypothetical protein [Candidatus Dependentiae bacterium]